MRKLIASALITSMVVGLAACGSSSSSTTTAAATTAAPATTAATTEAATEAATEKATEAAETTAASEEEMGPVMKSIKEKGYIVLGIDASYPPMSFMDPETQEMDGVMVNYGDALAAKLGVEARYQPEPFGTLISDLSAGNIDVINACVTVTEERKEVMAFADTLIKMADCMLVPADKASEYTDLSSFSGKTITANNGTSQYEHAQSVEGASVIGVDNTSDAVLQVLSGTADAAVVDNVTAQQYILKNPGKLELLEDANFGYEEDTVAIQLGNEDLLKVCNEVVAEQAPQMDDIIKKYTQMSMDMLGTN